MPPEAPSDLSDLGRFRNWKPEYQQQALDRLKQATAQPWRPFYCPDPGCNGRPHTSDTGVWDWEHARADQRPPRWSADWLTWVLRGGRGSGKTRTGAELTHRAARVTPRIILIGATGPDVRDTMVEGESGVLATAKPGERPTWEPSKKKLTWPNGCIAQGFSGEEPDRLRGPNSGFIWADEPAHWEYTELCWSNMQFGLRQKGINIHICATSTPLPTKWMKELLADPLTIQHRVSTYANVHNLADAFKRMILDKYEGTRLGAQELHGEILEDVEGALWSYGIIRWRETAPQLARIVVAVDPAGSKNKTSDETGIIVIGIDTHKNLYVLADYSGKYSPEQWARKANEAVDTFSADAIVAEKNYGGDMVRFTLENSGYTGARIILVNSRRGKAIRAEPVVALYEKSRVYHVGQRGDLGDLEDELTTWVPLVGDSPNRLDALVHGATQLAGIKGTVTTASPADVLAGQRVPTGRHLRAVGS